MSSRTVRDIVSAQHGKVGKQDTYVWATSYAKNFFEKMKEQIAKYTYILFVEGEKIHIYTLSARKKEGQVTEEFAYAIDQLQNISITTIGSQANETAKVITFVDPTGDKHTYYIPLTIKEYAHPHQEEHLNDLVEILMPTD
jgi:uncharacterized protein YnzC (UPF0291/DUF896 family)